MGVDAVLEIGPRTNIRCMTQRGFAPWLTMEGLRLTGSGIVDPGSPYIDHLKQLWFSEQLGGYILQPKFGWDDMAVADVTAEGGTPGIDTPPGYSNFLTGQPTTFLTLGTVDSAVDMTITSVGVLPACSCWVLSLAKWKAPAAGTLMADIHYTFDFGGQYRLTWGAAQVPIIYQQDGESWREIKRGIVADGEWPGFIAERQQNWQFYVLGSDLYLICSSLAKPIIVRDIGVNGEGYLPAAKWTFRVEGLPVMVNLSPLRFEVQGYLETVLDHTHVYPDPDGAFPKPFPLRTYPPYPTVGTTIRGQIVASADSRKRYRVLLTGNTADTPVGADYSTRTPLLQAMLPIHDPSFAEEGDVTDDWLPITQYGQDGEVTLSMDLGADRLHTGILLQARKDDAGTLRTFREYLAAHAEAIGIDPLLRGVFCVRVKVRNTIEDAYTTALTGLGLVVGDLHNPRLASVELEGYDRFVQLARALGDAPCGIGQAPEAAIIDWAEWVGVHPSAWAVTASGQVLTDPGREYRTPLHLPTEGNRAVEMIRQVVEKTGLVVTSNGDGTGTIAPAPVYTVAKTFTSGEGIADLTLSQLNVARELTAAANYFRYRGRDMDGTSFLHHRWDQASITTPGSESFLGEPVLQIIDLPDSPNRATLTKDAEKSYNRRDSGRPDHEVSAVDGLANIRPAIVIQVMDADLAPDPGRKLLVIGVRIPLRKTTDARVVLSCKALNPEQVAETTAATGWV
jgi:hypothetical protein